MKELISIIVPCYNEEATIEYFYNEFLRVMNQVQKYNFEIIFIDDGSRDKTLEILKNLTRKNQIIKYISFSRNFGKEAAMYAGLKKSKGNYIAIMDADLQDPPSLLPKMIKILQEGQYDSVATRRITRKGEPIIRSIFARTFYKLINKISKTEIIDGARDYRLMTRQFVNSLLEMSEYNRFSKGLFGWIGYQTKWIEFENRERIAGETKWSFYKLLLYSIEGIVAFSTMPLIISALIGIFFCLVSISFIIFIIMRTVLYGDPVSGWPSTICIILLLGGIQLFSIGILGEYLAKTYLETKKRPIFISKETNIDE